LFGVPIAIGIPFPAKAEDCARKDFYTKYNFITGQCVLADILSVDEGMCDGAV